MKCPTCQSENKPGREYCEMCYEPFTRSAADTYQRAIKRARAREAGEIPQLEEASPARSQAKPRYDRPSVLQPLLESAAARLWAWRRVALVVVGLLVAYVLVTKIVSPGTRFALFGARLAYSPPAKGEAKYVVGTMTEATRWAERAGQLYAPMGGPARVDDIGTLSFQPGKRTSSRGWQPTLSSLNWLVTRRDAARMTSQVLPRNHETLGAVRLAIDAKGQVTSRGTKSPARVAKAAVFIFPWTPKRRVKPGATWTDTAEWTDTVDGWTLRWAVERRWKAVEMLPCGEHDCVRLVYDAALTPRVALQPAWASSVRWEPLKVQGRGDALFDIDAKAVRTHALEYDATLRGRVPNLAVIPDTVRVGRRYFDAGGELVFQLKVRQTTNRQ